MYLNIRNRKYNGFSKLGCLDVWLYQETQNKVQKLTREKGDFKLILSEWKKFCAWLNINGFCICFLPKVGVHTWLHCARFGFGILTKQKNSFGSVSRQITKVFVKYCENRRIGNPSFSNFQRNFWSSVLVQGGMGN